MWFTAEMAEELEISSFESAEAFEAWLDRHHDSSPGIWLKLRKKVRGVVALDYAHALDVALCYGWIDGQKGRFDDEYWLQRFTPRKSKSKWSKINRDKVAALTEQGRMRPPGVAEVERAKADGRWESAYAGAKSAEVPDDLAEALAANAAAAAFFKELDSHNRYAILYRVQDVKKAETRARRIEKYVTMLARSEKIYP
ncbi:YdeI/OmpD-associated family protein [Streptomyces sp. NBC_01485]|uniref:YdeI/OmpD-associated family protein n=1 Tax=Streptomyces sp. NBC_01485 TaxID=2903884 RepID=UPI003FCD520D